MKKPGNLEQTLGIGRVAFLVRPDAVFFTVPEYIGNYVKRSTSGENTQPFQD